MISQELLNYMNREMKDGKDYFSIHKMLMRSEYKIKDIDDAYRLIRIVGLENINDTFLETIKLDKLYIKRNSGLSVWFNILFGLLLVNILINLIMLFLSIKTDNIFITFSLILNTIFLAVTAYGIFYAFRWAVLLFSLMWASLIYTVVNSVIEYGMTFFFILDILIFLIGLIFILKIWKKYRYSVP